jgi:hypothetical protein
MYREPRYFKIKELAQNYRLTLHSAAAEALVWHIATKILFRLLLLWRLLFDSAFASTSNSS